LPKNANELENKAFTNTGKIDLPQILPKIISEFPDLIPLIEKWPAVSIELRRAIGRMIE